jgi:hypothetical protein
VLFFMSVMLVVHATLEKKLAEHVERIDTDMAHVHTI